MVAHSTVEGNDATSRSSSSSSSSASSSPSSPPSDSDHLSSQPPRQRHPDQRPLAAVSAPAPVPAPAPTFATAAPVTTHFPTFRCENDYLLITHTASMLERSGFYWGPLGVEEAHYRLKDAAAGTFLIRDSRQKDVFFTLSYRAASGPVSVRILYKGQLFNLAGTERSFPCLFALLEYYITSPKGSLKTPYRKQSPTLQELCRKRIIEACGGGERGTLEQVPLNPILKDFLFKFPFRI